MSALNFHEMLISIRKICNQTAMATGLDPVTFPGMGSVRGKYVFETTKIGIFSYKAISNIFFSVSQPLIFLKSLCLSG